MTRTARWTLFTLAAGALAAACATASQSTTAAPETAPAAEVKAAPAPEAKPEPAPEPKSVAAPEPAPAVVVAAAPTETVTDAVIAAPKAAQDGGTAAKKDDAKKPAADAGSATKKEEPKKDEPKAAADAGSAAKKDEPKAAGGGKYTLVAVPAPDKKIERLWKSKCASCHGQDGKGATDKGKKMKVDDMTLAAWQTGHSNAELKKAIADGYKGEKGGVKQEMDGYGSELAADQVDALVQYCRFLGAPK